MKRFVLVLCMGAALPAHATTLKELLALADTQSVERRMSLETRQKAAAEFNQAWSALLPALTLGPVQNGWMHNQFPTQVRLRPDGPVAVISPIDAFDATVVLQLPLIDTGRWFKSAAAGAAEDAAEQHDEATRDRVRRQVATTYYNYAAALAQRDAAKRSHDVAEAQQHFQEVRAEAGAATELELLRAKAELQRTKQIMVDTEVAIATFRRSLRTLTGVELDENAALPADDLKSEGSLNELEGKLDTLPAVRAADKDADAAAHLATAARLALVPVLTATFTERFTNAGGLLGRNQFYAAGLGLVWRLDGPTLFGMSVQGSVARTATLGAEYQRLVSRDQVHSDWQRLTASVEKVTAAQAQVEAARRAADVAKERYTVGAATQIDVIQAERDLFAAEVGHVQARTELASSHVALRISAGLPLQVE